MPRKLGRSIGNVYALNTVGSILGAFCAGFILIPLIGIRPGIVLMAMLNVIVGCVLIFSEREALALLQRCGGRRDNSDHRDCGNCPLRSE